MHEAILNRRMIQMASVRPKINLKSINCCIPGLFSKCGAGATWAEHRACRFAIKSNFANKSMYYNHWMDGHCDCLEAQRDAMAIADD